MPPEHHRSELLLELLRPALAELAEMVAERTAERLAPLLTDRDQRPDDNLPHLLDVTAAAAYLGLARSTVYKMSSDGRLPTVKHGRRLLFRRQDLEDHVAGNLRPARGDAVARLTDRAHRR